jgi:hypothetical protein
MFGKHCTLAFNVKAQVFARGSTKCYRSIAMRLPIALPEVAMRQSR